MVTNANYRESITGRRVAVAVAIAVLLLGSLGLYSLNTTAINVSEVIISADPTSQKVESGETAWYTITLDNTDSEFDVQPVKLEASFQSGDVWDSGFSPTPGTFDSLAPVHYLIGGESGYVDNTVAVPKGSQSSVYFWVNTTANGHLLGERTIQVMGYDNWGLLTQGANVTKDPSGQTLNLKLTAVKKEDATVTIDDVNSEGNINVIQGEGIVWGFTVVNSGCDPNTFSFAGNVYLPGNPSPLNTWSFQFAGGNSVNLPGACSGSSRGESRAAGANVYDTSVTITPPDNAAAGQYEMELRISGTNVSISKRADAIIPLPDFVLEPGDVEFSHGSAWVDGRGASQEVTITVTVRNNGGNRDSAGRPTDHVDVDFVENNNMVDMGGSGSSSQTKYIPSLKHGEEATVTTTFTPNKSINNEVTDLIINVLVDMFPDPNDPEDVDIGESNSDNNDVTVTFKLVPATSTSPGFNVGFIALLGVAVVLAGLATRYRRQHLDEDEE